MKSSISEWLNHAGLGKHQAVFADNDIDVDILHTLTHDDLKELGLSLGDRKRFFSAVGESPNDATENDELVEPAVIATAEAERRHLTILFSDLVGSTELSLRTDPEELRCINRAYQDTVTHAVESYGGYVARYMGDGVLAYFGYPKAYEDDAQRAVRAGLDIVAGIKSMNEGRQAGDGLDLQVRVGIETGPVVVGDVIGKQASRESPVVGETPNLAARIQGVAAPNSVAVGPTTQSRVSESIRTESLGPKPLNGFPNPVEIWRVVGQASQGGRFDQNRQSSLGRFIGRAAELELMKECWLRAREGQTNLVEISGEAGIGKSRLVYEFLNSGREAAAILQGHCVSHGAMTAYLPFRNLLQRRCGLPDDPLAEHIRERTMRTLDELGLDPQHGPYLLKLFGITHPDIADVDTELVGIRTRDAIIAFILAHARSMPTVLFLNDLHWIDDSSRILLTAFTRQARSSRILVVGTCRPGHEVAWDDPAMVTRIALGPLSPAETTILMRDKLQECSIDSALLDTLLDRAGGNPLFAEELVRHALEREYKSASPLGESMLVPETLEGLLLQRVDRLSAAARRLLQAASVAGRRFRADLVAEVVGIEHIAAVLEELERHNLVRGDLAAGKVVFRFRHALVHDAVYSSLLRSDRHTLHHAIGSALERLYDGRELEICEDLARHFSGTDDTAKSCAYCALAGDKALGLFAISDARSWYARTLKQIVGDSEWKDDELLADVLVNQLEVLCFDADFEGMVELAETHLPRVIRLGKTRQVSRMYSWLGEAYLVSARFPEAGEVLERALQIGGELSDPACIGYATGDLMWLHALAPHLDVRHHPGRHDAVLDIARDQEIPYLSTLAYYSSALDLAQHGQVPEARGLASLSIGFGRDNNYPPALSWGHSMRAYIDTLVSDAASAVVEAREAIRHASCRYDRIMGETMLTYALVLDGQASETLAAIENLRAEVIERGVGNMLPIIDTAYGMVLVHTRGMEAGLDWFEETRKRLVAQGNKRALCASHFIAGELYTRVVPDYPDRPAPIFWGNIELRRHDGQDVLQEADRHLSETISLAEETAMYGVASQACRLLAALRDLHKRDHEAVDLARRAERFCSRIGSGLYANKTQQTARIT